MKHRSVIAFVIVAAALFAAPQLSHDLQNFKSALGSRLSGELMQAFLSLPPTEGTAAAVASRPAETLFASCTKERPAAKPKKNDPAPPSRAAVRAAESTGDQLAMIVEPVPVSEPWSAALPAGSLVGAAELPHKALGEVAMIIPPDSGVDPRGLARASGMATREGERRAQKLAEDVRVTFAATRLEGKGPEWRKVDEALHRLEETLPGGAYEYRLDRDGSKTRVRKPRRVAGANCPTPASCASLPAVATLSAFVSE